jgi:hypothetical protein
VRVLVGLALGLVVLLALAEPCGACSTGSGSAAFVGTAESIHGSAVTYRVEGDAKMATLGVAAGQVVVVDYPSSLARFIRTGQHYTVYAWGPTGALQSDVRSSGDCPASTTNADGTNIDTASRLLGMPKALVVTVAGLALLVAVAIAITRRYLMP